MVIAFLVLSGIVSYLSLVSQKSALEEIFGTRFKIFETSARLIKDATSVHANLYRVISWATANFDAKKIDELGKEQVKTLAGAVATVDMVLKTPGLTQEEVGSYKTVMAALAAYQKDALAAIDLAGSDSNMATMFMQTSEEKFQILYKDLNHLLELETRLGQVTYDNSITRFNASLTTSVLVLVIAIGVSILLSLLIAKIITGPVHKATKVIQKIAEGDLTQEIALTSTDEIGELAQSVDTMRRKMGEAVGGAVETSQTLSEAASEQAASIEETSSSLEEMASMTKSNAAGTAKANGLMAGAMETIEKANASMDRSDGVHAGDRRRERRDPEDRQDDRRDLLPDEPPGAQRGGRGRPGRRGGRGFRGRGGGGQESGLAGGGGGAELFQPRGGHRGEDSLRGAVGQCDESRVRGDKNEFAKGGGADGGHRRGFRRAVPGD